MVRYIMLVLLSAVALQLFGSVSTTAAATVTCKPDEFACGTGPSSDTSCVPSQRICDGVNDCKDRSDEKFCILPHGGIPCGCAKERNNCTGRSWFVNPSQLCDGYTDCGDFSDEMNCTCPADSLLCPFNKTLTYAWPRCMKISQFCEGYLRCADGSTPRGSLDGYFECVCNRDNSCGGGPRCIPMENAFRDTSYGYWRPFLADCPDSSDSMAKYCPATMFRCGCYNSTCSGFNGCRRASDVCNGFNDCGDWSDERGCEIPKGSFRCDCERENGSCTSDWWFVASEKRCDGLNDCGDVSDERGCSCAVNYTACDCYHGQGCYYSAGCYRSSKRCDGILDCEDSSDERNCTCPDDEFQCRCNQNQSCFNSYVCINRRYLCDGNIDCSDWSDEVNCELPNGTLACDCYWNQNCKEEKLFFRPYWYPQSKACDGYVFCEDGSDERNCSCKETDFRCDCHKTNTCKAQYSGCVPKDRVCDQYNHCGDWSDEKNCSCEAPLKPCRCLNSKCTQSCYSASAWNQNKCSTFTSCGDWSDEFYCRCSDHGFQCASCPGNCYQGEGCINRTSVCDGKWDCHDGSDEVECNSTAGYVSCGCLLDTATCNASGHLIKQQWIADGVEDCPHGEDELCETTRVWCEACPVIVSKCKPSYTDFQLTTKTFNYLTSCSSDSASCRRTGLLITSSVCNETFHQCKDMFLCQDGNFIANRYFCDTSGEYFRTCPDDSDEIRSGFGFKCSGTLRIAKCVLPQVNIFDSVAQCLDGSDLCFQGGDFKCFQCLDKRLIISKLQVCDGIIDCHDVSDECLCENQTVCEAVLGDSKRTCPAGHMHCRTDEDCVPISKVLCNKSMECSNHRNTKYCMLEEEAPNSVPAPVVNNDPCVQMFLSITKTIVHHSETFVICDGLRHTYQEYRKYSTSNKRDCSLFDERNCPMRFSCKSGLLISIPNAKVCDGVIDCDAGEDERKTQCNTTRFFCPQSEKISVDIKFQCDGIVDCDDASDEDKKLCNNRFYCTNGQPLSIPDSFVENGIKDCADGSDECKTTFSDRYEMISNPFLRAMFWVMGSFAIVGNGVVFFFTVRKLWCQKNCKVTTKCTLLLIASLSFADFVMGLYLIITVSKGVTFKGSYCSHDMEWRSSSLCKGLGFLVIWSTESSAFTMATITTYRLIAALKPFKASSITPFHVSLGLILCWTLSTLLGVLPLVISGYFVSSLWFPNQFYKSDEVSKANFELLAGRLVNKSIGSWAETSQVIQEHLPFNPIKAEFLYYGTTSICMPQIFSQQKDSGWQYSFLIITLNFLLFVYIVAAYVIIYKASNKMAEHRSTDTSKAMQRRIFRLILTDFFCWIPICVMAYISLSGIPLPPDAYVASACILLPLNSALNPILYSKYIEERVVGCFRPLWELTTSSTRSTDT